MSCQVQINTIDLLQKKNVIDDFSREGRNRILNITEFEKLNDKYTQLAKIKYPDLPMLDGQLLFTIDEIEATDVSRSRYWRDAKYKTAWAVPNKELFDKIQIEFDKVQAKLNEPEPKIGPDGQYRLFGLSFEDPEKLEFETTTLGVINQFLENIGVEQRLVSNFYTNEGTPVEGALAAANFINGTVDIIEDFDKRPSAWNKLPEEAAHWWYRLLKEDSGLKKMLWESHKTTAKRNQLYNTTYGKTVSKPEDLTEEAIGQLIAEAIKKIENQEGAPEDYGFLRAFIKWINDLLKSFKSIVEDPFEVAAMKILSSDMTDLMSFDEYRKLNNIVYFDAVLDDQSVAPMDYTIIEDIGSPVIPQTYFFGVKTDKYYFVFNSEADKQSPNFDTQEELDAWVYTNVKEYVPRQKAKLQEVRDSEVFFDRLLNKRYKKRTRFLKKTLSKYYTIVGSTEAVRFNKFQPYTSDLEITKPLDKSEKKILESTNNYTNLTPTLKVLPLILQKYKKNPIVLSEKLKVDGMKKQEAEVIEAVKDLIVKENPKLKTISAEDLANEVYNYLKANYTLGFANELTHLNYRVATTFGNTDGGEGQVEHNKISIRFNDTYHLKLGHFQYSPSAWANLTKFYSKGLAKFDAVLLHEIQNDNIEHLRDFLRKGNPIESEYQYFLNQISDQLKANIDSILNNSFKIDKYLDRYVTNGYIPYFIIFSENISVDAAYNQLKEMTQEKIDLYESSNAQEDIDSFLKNIDETYSQRRRIQSLMRNGGLKSLLTKQQIDEIQQIINEVNEDERYYSLSGKKSALIIQMNTYLDIINKNFKEKYNTTENLITNANYLAVKAQPRSGYSQIDKSVNRFLLANTNKLLDSTNKQIDDFKTRLVGAFKARSAYNFNNQFIKITKEQFTELRDNILFNQKLFVDSIDIQAQKDLQIAASNAANLSDADIISNLTKADYREPYFGYSFKGWPLKANTERAAIKEVRELTSEKKIEIQKQKVEKLKAKAAIKKQELDEKYESSKLQATEILPMEMGYFTPLIHYTIQKHIKENGKDMPLYFSGFKITQLTQGSNRTALIYAGKDEVKFTKEEADKIKYEAAIRLGLITDQTVTTKEALKLLADYKKQSERNMNHVVNTIMSISNNQPIETGAIYNAMSQVAGVKLIWVPAIEGIDGEPGGYKVDLTNYNFDQPVLYGLDTTVNKSADKVTEPTEMYGIPLVDINVDTLQDARSKRVAEVLAEKLSLGLNIRFENITPEQAAKITRVSATPYNGEAAFYYAGTVYVVGDNVNVNTILHEFAHPVINGIRIKNRKLFDNLYDSVLLTVEGQQIRDNVLQKYPELQSNPDMLKSEILTYALQMAAVNKLTNKIQTEGFDAVINKILAAIKQLIRSVFGNKQGISSINVDTTIDELGRMLLEDEIDMSEYAVTNDDLIQYGKFVTERANELTKAMSSVELEKIINEWYAINKAILDRARNFKTDKAVKDMLIKSIFGEREGSTNLLPEAVSSLRRFQTITDFGKYSKDQLMSKVLDAEEDRLKELDRQARALINSIDKIDIIAENMLNDLGKIYKEKNVSARNTIALVNFYKQNSYAWKETIDQFNEIIREGKLDMDKDNLFYKVINKINANLDEINVVISQIYKKNNIQFYVELTGPMNEFVQDEFKKNLNLAFKNAYKSQADRDAAVESFYNKVISQEDVTDDLEALYKNGVPKEVLSRFLDLYQNMVATPEKIQNALTGHAKDVSWFNRFLESYTSSNDPIVGSLALFIQNQRTEITNDFMDGSGSFLKALEKLLPQVNFTKLNVTQIQDMVTYEDTIMYWDKNTGKPIERKIRTFLHEFGNGYRYAEDILEYNLAEARASKDQEKIIAAREDLKQFRKDYMWQEFVPEYYESDEVYDEIIPGYDAATSKRIAMEAYSDRQNALDDYNNLLNEHDDELSRFKNYSSLQAAFRKFKQLSSLTYEDGTPKIDDPKKGIYDLSKAKLLQRVNQAKSKFYEFVPLQKSLESAYNEFINNLATDGITREHPEFDKEIKEWRKQNLTMKYDPKYAQRRRDIIDRIGVLQAKMNLSFDTAGAYREINDLIFTYRDELGQPITPELGEEKVKRIQELEQSIINFRESLDRNSGLSQEERAYLNTLTAMVKRGTELSAEQKRQMINLLKRQSKTGLTVTEAAELQNLFAELGELSEKIPTDYYLDALNFHLSRLEAGEVTADEVEDFINEDKFQELLEEDEKLRDWFEMNHVTKKRKVDDQIVLIYEPTIANRITVPINKDYIMTTKIVDQETGETVTLEGVPNARHSRYQVKNEFRTIPIGESWDQYVGTYVDNKGNYLPRLFDPSNKHSAKNAKFMNQRFFDLKRSNNAEYKLLEEMKKFHLGVQKGQSNYSKLYLDMPRHALKAGDLFQAMQRGKIGERFKTFTDWKNQLVGKSVTDFERGYNYDAKNNLVNTDLKGNQITYVPVEGIYNLELENTDADIITGLFKYGMSIKTQGKLLESLPIVESIVSTLEDPANQPKNMDAYSKGIFNVRNLYQNPTKAGAENNRLGQVRSLIEREYLGRQTASFEESNPKLAKWLDIVQGLSTRASLAVNIPSDLKNQFSGYMQSMIESIGGEFITSKDYAMAIPWSTQAMLTWASKDAYAVGPGSLSGQMLQRFDPTFTSEDKFGNSVSKSLVKDLANGSWMYAHRKFGEMDVAVKLFGAFLHGQKVNQLVNGKQVSMRYVDAFELDSDGLMRLKAGVDAAWDTKSVFHNYTKGESLKQIADRYNITVEELKKRNNIESEIQLEDGQEIIIAKSEKFKAFKNRLQGTSRRLFGAYDRFGQPEGNKFIIYRMFFFMRKWFTPMLTNRWGMNSKTASLASGGERYDWALGRYTKGYYVNAFQTLVRILKSKGAEMSYMTDQEKADLRRTMAEGMIIIVASLIASMLFGFDPDDDDKWDKIKARSGAINQDSYNTYGFLANHMLLLLLGVQAETSAFVPLPKIFGINLGADDYTKMLTSTSASWYNTVVLYVQIMGDVLNFVTFDEAARYEKDQGPYWWQQEGALKFWERLFNVFGFTGGTGDPATVLKNFQNNSSRYGG